MSAATSSRNAFTGSPAGAGPDDGSAISSTDPPDPPERAAFNFH
jgi:hypothetical protein